MVIDLYGTDQDQFTSIPPPPQFSSGLRTTSFSIVFNSYTPDAQAAFQYAADIWGSVLISEVPIKVNTYFTALLPGVLGITLPNGIKNFQNAPVNDVWYASCLANALSGTELNAGENDFDLYLNSSTNWYFGTDGNCPAGKYDFVTTALHEICHGLGFLGLANGENNLGSFGLITAADFFPIVTSFPFPDLEGKPGIFDEFLYNQSDEQLTDTVLFPNSSAQLYDEFTGNFVSFSGTNAIDNNGGSEPVIYTPSSFSLGSSMVHLDEITYPAGNINDLMTPFAGTAEVTHDPGPVAVGVLKDMGWSVNYNVGINDPAVINEAFKVFPNPVINAFTLAGLQGEVDAIEISDLAGRQVIGQIHPEFPYEVSGLQPGLYLLRVKNNQKVLTSKIQKK